MMVNIYILIYIIYIYIHIHIYIYIYIYIYLNTDILDENGTCIFNAISVLSRKC